ncbi:cupredoxin domain-containing protein [Rhodanobacter denitrificans]|uniref:Cupredoxin domain-containing protein n=1 Tax=Rhodanobacter denitrificans TaxID=666685 RepID=A0A368KHT9_9GAMM|nr:cupredoxin domain-containing protein [Rhodanobacter denitrificans]RCS30686.1 cupredoxin domain-containing protein [Rhodanobacter denitrificans]
MKRLLMLAAVALLTAAGTAAASDVPEYTLVIKNHRYQPSEIRMPANTKVRIVVHNQDPTPEEFESTDFNREKLVLPNSSATVYVGPLRAGTYGFFGDFHQDTALGRLIVE